MTQLVLCSLKACSPPPPGLSSRRGTSQRAFLRPWLVVSAPHSLVRTACSAMNDPANTTRPSGAGRRAEPGPENKFTTCQAASPAPTSIPSSAKWAVSGVSAHWLKETAETPTGERHTMNAHPKHLRRSVTRPWSIPPVAAVFTQEHFTCRGGDRVCA